jgi:hypothetical protein
MAYAERRERKKRVRYRGIYKAADGRIGPLAPLAPRNGRSGRLGGGAACRRGGRWYGGRVGSWYPRDADDQGVRADLVFDHPYNADYERSGWMTA